MAEHWLPELAEPRRRLEACSPAEATLLVQGWRKLECANASFVEFFEVLTACLGCNTACYFLGGGESAKAAMYYMIKYVTKDSVELNALLSIVKHAREHIDVFTSRAADAETHPAQRKGQHLLARVNNQVDNELSDTFAASLCLGYSADGSSESFVNWSPWDAVKEAGYVGPDPLALDPFDEEEVAEAEEQRAEGQSSEAQHVPAGGATGEAEHEPDEAEQMEVHEGAEQPADRLVAVGGVGDASELDSERYTGFSDVYDNGVPVKEITHYQYRGLALLMFTEAEYRCAVAIVRKRHVPGGSQDKRGAQEMPRFPFAKGHPVHETHEQQLCKKIPVPQLVGPTPPHPPVNLSSGGVGASPTWRRANDRFLGFVAATHVPWMPPQRFFGAADEFNSQAWEASGGATVPMEGLDVEAWCAELQNLALEGGETLQGFTGHQTRVIAEGRLQALDRLAHGLLVGEAAKAMGGFFRTRHRKKWPPDHQCHATPAGSEGAGSEDASGRRHALDDLVAMHEARQLDRKRVLACEREAAWLERIDTDLAGLEESAGSAPGRAVTLDVQRVGQMLVPAATVSDLVYRLTKKSADAAPLPAAAPPPAAPTAHDSAFASASDPNALPDEFVAIAMRGNSETPGFEELYARWKSENAQWEKDRDVAKAANTPFSTRSPAKVLNPQQRAFCRTIWPIACAMRNGRQANVPRAQYALAAKGIGQLFWLLHGAGGNGKTTMLEVLQHVFEREDVGTVVFTAYQGVAVTSLPRPSATFCSLFYMNGAHATTPATQLKHEQRFESIAGPKHRVVALVIDEISQLGCNNLGHASNRLKKYLECDEDFGGLIVIAPGDLCIARPRTRLPLPAAPRRRALTIALIPLETQSSEGACGKRLAAHRPRARGFVEGADVRPRHRKAERSGDRRQLAKGRGTQRRRRAV